MTFPFEPNHDVVAERRARGPVARGDLIATIVLIVVGAIAVGVCGAAGLLMLTLSLNAGGGVVVLVPAVVFLAGLVVALLRLRSRKRAWPAPAITLGVIALAAGLGTLWWTTSSGLA